MNTSTKYGKMMKNLVVGIFAATLLFSSGCSSFPWSKKKDQVFSPKPPFTSVQKEKKSKSRPSRSIDEFLERPRVSY